MSKAKLSRAGSGNVKNATTFTNIITNYLKITKQYSAYAIVRINTRTHIKFKKSITLLIITISIYTKELYECLFTHKAIGFRVVAMGMEPYGGSRSHDQVLLDERDLSLEKLTARLSGELG